MDKGVHMEWIEGSDIKLIKVNHHAWIERCDIIMDE